jgi:hypothetical protein
MVVPSKPVSGGNKHFFSFIYLHFSWDLVDLGKLGFSVKALRLAGGFSPKVPHPPPLKPAG